MKKMLGALIFVLALFAVCNAGWAAGPAVATAAAAQPGCQPVLDLGKTLAAQGMTCPATTAPKAQTVPAPDFLVGGRTKTCRCSCGYPCTTDADCGGGVGSCRAGISCC